MDYWGGGGQRVCWPPLQYYWGAGPGPPWPLLFVRLCNSYDYDQTVRDFNSLTDSLISASECAEDLVTVNPLYNDIRYNSKIRYNINSVCTKISRSCIFSLAVPCYSLGKIYVLDIC